MFGSQSGWSHGLDECGLPWEHIVQGEGTEGLLSISTASHSYVAVVMNATQTPWFRSFPWAGLGLFRYIHMVGRRGTHGAVAHLDTGDTPSTLFSFDLYII